MSLVTNSHPAELST